MGLRASKKQRKAEFLRALENRFEIEAACRAVGVSRQAVYKWRLADPEFERAIQEARKPAVERLKAHMYDIAMNEADPETGKRPFSDRDMVLASMFLIKAHDPAYKDSYRPAIDVADMRITLAIPAPPSFQPKQLTGDVIDADIVSEEG